jgi:hypothetical protein
MQQQQQQQQQQQHLDTGPAQEVEEIRDLREKVLDLTSQLEGAQDSADKVRRKAEWLAVETEAAKVAASKASSEERRWQLEAARLERQSDATEGLAKARQAEVGAGCFHPFIRSVNSMSWLV